MNSPTEDIQLISTQDIFSALSGIIANLEKDLDCYVDARNLASITRVLLANEEKLRSLKNSGARLRCITEMTGDNLSECKKVMQNFELFHTSGLRGSFLIADEHEYMGFLMAANGKDNLLRIITPEFVEAQRFVINILIERAVPANQRILEIGKGTGEEFMETIKDHPRVRALISALTKAAIYEISILFSTKNSFLIAEREGILEEVGRASTHGIIVRILVMQDETVKEISNRKLKVPHQNIQVNYLQQLLPTRITTIIFDQAKTLTIEVNDDTKETFQESIGISTYSNSESTVFSNISFFDSLWIQAELDKQNKARQAYFQLFKGFKLKDEVYNRRWSNRERKEKTDQ